MDITNSILMNMEFGSETANNGPIFNSAPVNSNPPMTK